MCATGIYLAWHASPTAACAARRRREDALPVVAAVSRTPRQSKPISPAHRIFGLLRVPGYFVLVEKIRTLVGKDEVAGADYRIYGRYLTPCPVLGRFFQRIGFSTMSVPRPQVEHSKYLVSRKIDGLVVQPPLFLE